MRSLPFFSLLILSFAQAATAQSAAVAPTNQHTRVLLVVPMTGSGTLADPKRPLLAPAQIGANRNGILEFHYQLSDDGNFAIVTVAAERRAAVASLLTDARVVKVFEKGRASRAQIETEMRRYKRAFDLDRFAGGVKPATVPVTAGGAQ